MKSLVIAKESVKDQFEGCIVYPYEKGIEEMSYEDLLKIESERGTGALGSSGK